MAILRRFIQFLEWLETAQDFVHFLFQPLGLSIMIALLLYYPIQALGCDALSAAALSSVLLLTCCCLLERPDF